MKIEREVYWNFVYEKKVTFDNTVAYIHWWYPISLLYTDNRYNDIVNNINRDWLRISFNIIERIQEQ